MNQHVNSNNFADKKVFWKPHPLLNEYVDHFTTKAFESGSEDYQLVVPDGMTELVINFGTEYNRIDKILNKELTVRGSHLIGPKSTYCYVKPSAGMDAITVRFKPGALKNFTNIPQSLLVDKIVDAYDIFGKEFKMLEDKLFEAADVEDRISVLNSFFLALIDFDKDKTFDKIISEIKLNIGENDLKLNSMLSGIYYKRLERLFKNNLGITPKKSMKILQFNYATYLFSVYKNLTQVACHAGYFDQAHFIKSFTAFSGVSPKHYTKISSKMFSLNQEVINSQFR